MKRYVVFGIDEDGVAQGKLGGLQCQLEKYFASGDYILMLPPLPFQNDETLKCIERFGFYKIVFINEDLFIKSNVDAYGKVVTTISENELPKNIIILNGKV